VLIKFEQLEQYKHWLSSLIEWLRTRISLHCVEHDVLLSVLRASEAPRECVELLEKYIAACSEVTAKDLLALASTTRSRAVLMFAALNKAATPAVHNLIFGLPICDDEVRRAIALSASDDNILSQLSKSEDEFVRHAVAVNEHAPHFVLCDLAMWDRSEYVRTSAELRLDERGSK